MKLVYKKNNFFLMIPVFVCCMTFGVFAGTSDEKSENTAVSGSTSSIFNQQDNKTLDHSLTESLHKMTLAVLIVIALGVLAMYATKKVLPKLSHMQGKKIQIIETFHLGSRKTLHLLEVSGQQILIGSTPDGITKLADIFTEKEFPLSKINSDSKDEASE